jgi:hypothetical protein
MMETSIDGLILKLIDDTQALEALAYAENNDVVRSLANRHAKDLMWAYREVMENDTK